MSLVGVPVKSKINVRYRIPYSPLLFKLRHEFLMTLIDIHETADYNLKQFDQTYVFTKPEERASIHLSDQQIDSLRNTYIDGLINPTLQQIQKVLFGYKNMIEKLEYKRSRNQDIKEKEKKRLESVYENARQECLDVISLCRQSIDYIHERVGFTRFRDNYILEKKSSSKHLEGRIYVSINYNKKVRFADVQTDFLFHYVKTYISLRTAIVGLKSGDPSINMLFIQKFTAQEQKENRKKLKKLFQNIKIYLLFLSIYSPSQKTNLFEYDDKKFYLQLPKEYMRCDNTLRKMYLPLKGDDITNDLKKEILDKFVTQYVNSINTLIEQHNTNDRDLYQILKDHDFEYLQLIKERMMMYYKSGIEIFDGIDYPAIFEDVIKRLMLIEVQLQEYRPLDFDYYAKNLPDIRHVINAANGVYDEYIKQLTDAPKHTPSVTPSELSPAPEDYTIPSPLDEEAPFDISLFLSDPVEKWPVAQLGEFDQSLFKPIILEPTFTIVPRDAALPTSSSAPEVSLEPQFNIVPFEASLFASSSIPEVSSEIHPEYAQYIDEDLLLDPELIETNVLGYQFYEPDYDDLFESAPKRRSLGKKRDEMMSLLSFMFEPPRIYSKKEMKEFDKNDPNFHIIDKKDPFSMRYAAYNTPKGMLNQIPEREGRSLDLYTSLDPMDDQLVLSLKRGFRISTEYLYKLLLAKEKGRFPPEITNFVLIDARWSYEYEAGHIKGSLNINLHYDIGKIFWREDRTPKYSKSTAIIMFCQYTHKRSVKLYRRMMKADRNFDYPNVYLLEGGYDLFFKHALFTAARRDRYFEPSFKYQQEEVIGEESEDLSAKEWARLQQSKKSKKPALQSRLTTRRIPTFDLSGASSSKDV